MAERHVEFALIGGGLASGNCARWLREEGADGSILLIGREPDLPYNRPDCSKGYLQGKESLQDTLFRPDEWWAEQSIELQTRTSVLKLDLEDRVAVLSTQEEVSFDKALVATGANVRLLRVEGVGLEGIHYLRALGNADTIEILSFGAVPGPFQLRFAGQTTVLPTWGNGSTVPAAISSTDGFPSTPTAALPVTQASVSWATACIPRKRS